MSSPIQKFADNLKLIRKGRNLTQTQLAEKVGLTKQSIINYEKGLTFPTGNRLTNLLEALDVNAEQLMGRELSQATSERVLLEACENKAQFQSEYRLLQEETSSDSTKQVMLKYLEKFNEKDLYDAILNIYNSKIQLAQEEYTKELMESKTHPQNENLNMDIWIKQNEDME